MSAAKKGRKVSPETLARMSIAAKGRIPWIKGKKVTFSPEHKANISAAAKGRTKGISRGKNHYRYKHGLEKHPLKGTHQQMMSRCYVLKHRSYYKYGAIGTTVWEPWHDITRFIFGILSLIGDRPPGHTLDRINPHGDYVEWNVRWADIETQNANLREKVPDYYYQCGEH
jgi:NUMOD3 motif